MLTISGMHKGETKLTIPNQVVREQLFAYILDTYHENDLTFDSYEKRKLASGLAYDGKWKPYFEYRMVPADSRRIPRVPRYSGYRYAAFRFTYWTITVYGHIFQSVLFTICIQCRGPTTPATPCDATGLGCSPFARHYWGNH